MDRSTSRWASCYWRSAAPRPLDHMRALIVGLGSAGRRHARNWAALGAGEVWVCRQAGLPQPEPLGVDAREFRDLDLALAAQPDVVIVSNPTSMHVETTCKALRA